MARVADSVTLRKLLSNVPAESLQTLSAVAELPGFARAAAHTLTSAWNADLALSEPSARDDPRWRDVAILERHVIESLPPGTFTVQEAVRVARTRAHLAPGITGDLVLDRLAEIPPVYRPLLDELSAHVSVRWNGQHADTPPQLPNGIQFEQAPAAAPRLELDICSEPQHEVVEALRWARQLLAEGAAHPNEIAIAAASPEAYDHALVSLADESSLPLHFGHGFPALATLEGQACAALADVLLRGLHRHRVARLVSLSRSKGHGSAELADLPDNWLRALPSDAPLTTLERWERALAPRGDDLDQARMTLSSLGRDLVRGTNAAPEIAERWLRGKSLQLWRRALEEGPASAVDVSLELLTVDDGIDPHAAIVWCPASSLAASPRKFVRLLGLSSRSWPRRGREDPLLPDHALRGVSLHERSLAQRDRSDFLAIIRSTDALVAMSRPKRDAEGRRLAPSPLLRQAVPAAKRELLPRRLPDHAFSEADRKLARPSELAMDGPAQTALAAWRDWFRKELTAHDGLVAAGHPAIQRALARIHSATSLRQLLRNPIGFVWTYALGWSMPDDLTDDLVLNPREFGEFVHRTLEATVLELESRRGLVGASEQEIAQAARGALQQVAGNWELERTVPPRIIWSAHVEEAYRMTVEALSVPIPTLNGQISYAEVPFGHEQRGDEDEQEVRDLPWDATASVQVAEGLQIRGRIDRLDLSDSRRRARVIDYKTSRNARKLANREIDIDEGKELQRCLYAYAVRHHLGPDCEVEATLVYPAVRRSENMRDPKATLRGLNEVVARASGSLIDGYAIPGPDVDSDWFEHRLALPADLRRGYLFRKQPGIDEARRSVDEILSAEPRETAEAGA